MEGIEIANKQWKMGTEGPCKDGEADHCMPFCGKWIGKFAFALLRAEILKITCIEP